MHEWAPVLKVVPPVVAVLGLLISACSFLVSGTNMARQWPGAFQRITGYMMAALGGLALASSAFTWIVVYDVPHGHWRFHDILLAIIGVLGLVMFLGGARRARNAPVDRDTEPLRALAADIGERDIERDRGTYRGSESQKRFHERPPPVRTAFGQPEAQELMRQGAYLSPAVEAALQAPAAE